MSRPDTTYARWAAACLTVEDGAVLTGPEARRHYVAWVSDHPGGRREAPGRARAAILGLDGSITRKGRTSAETKYHGVRLTSEGPEFAGAVAALLDAGLITTSQFRRVAAERLAQ